jgi:hypothetical protein
MRRKNCMEFNLSDLELLSRPFKNNHDFKEGDFHNMIATVC